METIAAAIHEQIGAPLGLDATAAAAAVLAVTTNQLAHAIRLVTVEKGHDPRDFMRTSGRTADPAVRAERMRFIPMRRPGEADEVAYTILFLASDESSYITGSEIHVDGGILAI